MRIFATWIAGFSLLIAAAAPAATGDFADIPALKARVTDTTGTLAPSEASRIEGKLAAFEKQRGTQLVVLMVPTTQPEAIEQYSIRVAEAWKIGRKGTSDGVILLVAKNDRKLRIEVGYGLEGAIPDAIAKRIISESIAPRFRNNDYAGGIEAGVDKLMAAAAGEALPAPKEKNSWTGRVAREISGEVFIFAFFAAVVVGGMLRAILGRFLGATVTGGGLGVIAWLVSGALGIAALIGIVAFFFVLFGGTGIGGGGGGGGWSGGSSSGGGDSFSGGGGDFGGGGASGDW